MQPILKLPHAMTQMGGLYQGFAEFELGSSDSGQYAIQRVFVMLHVWGVIECNYSQRRSLLWCGEICGQFPIE